MATQTKPSPPDAEPTPLFQEEVLPEDPIKIIKDGTLPSKTNPRAPQGVCPSKAKGDSKLSHSSLSDISPEAPRHDGPTEASSDPTPQGKDSNTPEKQCRDKSRGKGNCHVPRTQDPRKEEHNSSQHGRHGTHSGTGKHPNKGQVDGSGQDEEPKSLKDVTPTRRSSKVRPVEEDISERHAHRRGEPADTVQVDGPVPTELAEDTDEESSDQDLVTCASHTLKGKKPDLPTRHPDGDRFSRECVKNSHSAHQIDGESCCDGQDDSKSVPPPDDRHQKRHQNGCEKCETQKHLRADTTEKCEPAEGSSSGHAHRNASQVDGGGCCDGNEDDGGHDDAHDTKCPTCPCWVDCSDGDRCLPCSHHPIAHQSQVDGECACPDGASDTKADSSHTPSDASKTAESASGEKRGEDGCPAETKDVCPASGSCASGKQSGSGGSGCQLPCDGCAERATGQVDQASSDRDHKANPHMPRVGEETLNVRGTSSFEDTREVIPNVAAVPEPGMKEPAPSRGTPPGPPDPADGERRPSSPPPSEAALKRRPEPCYIAGKPKRDHDGLSDHVQLHYP